MALWGSQDAPTSRSPKPEGCIGQYRPKDARIIRESWKPASMYRNLAVQAQRLLLSCPLNTGKQHQLTSSGFPSQADPSRKLEHSGVSNGAVY